MFEECGAQFATLFDRSTTEIRHWNNDRVIEDVATDSTAGVVGVYPLKHHNLVVAGRRFSLVQARFTGSPSRVLVQGDTVGGEIVP